MDKSEKRTTVRNDVVNDWYAMYRNDLLRYWTSGMPPHRAEDLVQEVFSNLLKVEDVRLIGNPRAYLFKIARSVLAEWYAQAQRFPSADVELDSLVGEAPSDANPPEHRHQMEQLDRALTKLPPTLRAAIVFHSKHGLTYDQIADRLHMSKRMVKRHVHKGYVQLRLLLDNDPDPGT